MKRLVPIILTLVVASCDTPLPPPTLPGPDSSPPHAAAESDSAALAALYDATDGDNWKRNDNWLSGEDLGDWYGVTTDSAGRVIWLWLYDNGLSGRLPPELGDLSYLERLTISDNDLPDSIPTELGGLSRLTYLSLGYNSLIGPIPSDLGDLDKLEQLALCGNDLTGEIPTAIGNLDRLEQLNLCYNDLTGSIPAELGNLGRLKRLSLTSNQLADAIPPELGDLDSLTSLGLAFNKLTGTIPHELGSLARLELLDLQQTDLNGGVPSSFGKMENLQDLWMGGSDSLSGELPLELTNLTRMEWLTAWGTKLCAPRDQGFQAWLNGLERADVAICPKSMYTRDAYLTQAVQSRDNWVPLVAGEKALLRVFLESSVETDENLPKVRARFYRNGTHSYVKNIVPEAGRPIPTEIDEGDLEKSVNLEIPGRVIQPGLEMVLEIDPDSTLDLDSLGLPSRIPETGRMEIDVHAVHLLDITAIPFLWESDPDSSIIDTIDDMVDDPEGHSLLSNTRTLLPVGDLYVTAHDPVVSDTNNAYILLSKTYAIWVTEGGSGYYYMGMMAGRVIGAAGVAYLGIPTNFSVPSNYVIGHELGHNMNLLHAPCGGPASVDPLYPDSTGAIVDWGFDFENDSLIHRSAKDMMSYCIPRWISGYHFNRATTFRVEEELEKEEMPPPAEEALLLWGGLDVGGAPFLEPAFVVEAPAFVPKASGDHRLVGRTDAGKTLFSLSFDMPEVADAEGEYTSFAFALPTEPGWEDLASITLSGPSGSATLDSETHRPSAMVRDPETGQVQMLMLDLDPDTRTAEDARAALSVSPHHTLMFSRGVPGADAWLR